ncbi:TetR/AcrR family transcriptional regulator [Bacillus sp. DX1.1]|uniref:TetR/AcrR family transcriptional regulator n=1 Tax=unclassified Bacillus (in: firmicutes) TaxID=185979 RepID=UPI002570015E|nr:MULTISPECIES: TetR/AcrR family transcriptional regulator [unclassified Bacillus (in: firmicutes)]MDM5155273.1 TetR/AcrR family transcriptional regulator [Bacillus sp. DX1.1]WJE79593.1 TetR/AcrR family transcriptional regulator [Bacillus sp. DX3.1]
MSERTNQKLVDAGIKLISKSGYGSTSIDQIVRHAEVSKGAFYAHFSSKEEFLIKILHDGVHFYFRDLQGILEQTVQMLFKKNQIRAGNYEKND